MNKLHLTIYVSQNNSQTESITREIDELLQAHYADNYKLDVVNVLHMPEKAIEHDVFATPTVVRTIPEPMIKLLVGLSDAQSVLTKIDIEYKDGKDTIII